MVSIAFPCLPHAMRTLCVVGNLGLAAEVAARAYTMI